MQHNWQFDDSDGGDDDDEDGDKDDEDNKGGFWVTKGELLLVARRSHLKGRAPFRERDQIDLEDNLIFCFFYHLNFVLHIFFGVIGYQRDLEDNLIFRFFSFEFCPPYFFEVYERP